jgi:addiction module RelE/StbE family toxin
MEIKFTKQALDDLDNIYDFIASENEKIAKQILVKIGNTLDIIRDFPDIGRQIGKMKAREIVVSKLPFLVVYKIIDRQIFVLTIFHTARNPLAKF